MVYIDNGVFAKISNYQHVINIGPLKLICFNDLHLLLTIFTLQLYRVQVSWFYSLCIGIQLEY